jgi:hypothetical protein
MQREVYRTRLAKKKNKNIKWVDGPMMANKI